MRFRPCIDLRGGKVVQIVGGSLKDGSDSVTTNFEAENDSTFYAKLYRAHSLSGGHVIALGPGNEDAALRALSAFPGGLQFGGGVNRDNAARYLEAGASHVIVTSYLFANGELDWNRLSALSREVGKERLVLDLSCRKRDGAYWVVTDRWQTFTNTKVDADSLSRMSEYANEFLVHGVDVEGLRAGMDLELIALIGEHARLPVTYAGGARSLEDLDTVETLGRGRIDLTIGSALDIFGGDVPFAEVVDWQRRR